MDAGIPSLVLDACALLHAKQLSDDRRDAVAFFDDLLDLGVCFASTKKVYGEHIAMSMSDYVERWKGEERYRTPAVSMTERRRFRNLVKRQTPMPGRKDVDLVILARREASVFLTHDDPAAGLANKAGVLTVDLIDVAGLLERTGVRRWADLNQRLEALSWFAWRPHDWRDSAQDTLTARPWARAGERLDTWLAGEAP